MSMQTSAANTVTTQIPSNTNAAYWNKMDVELNSKHRHTPKIYSDNNLLEYYNYYNINKESLNGLKRYMIENDCKPIALTLQGAAYSAIDILNGRRVIIKCSNINLVNSNISRNGKKICENIKKEAGLMHYISNRHSDYSDSYISQFVDWFKTDEHYYLVSEHGGIEFFDYLNKFHPKRINNESNIDLTNEWKHNMKYYFRMICRSVYYLHNFCNIAHLDLSLENIVIDTNTNVVRIIDFGLAKHFGNKNINNNNNNNNNNNDSGNRMNANWQYDGIIGKNAYHSPEIRNIYNYVLKIQNSKNTNGIVEISDNMKYDARSADVWAIGVILFMMLAGCQPWHVAESSDTLFKLIANGKIRYVLDAWNSTKYVDNDGIDLLTRIFKPENERININGILDHPYVKFGPRTIYQNDSLLNKEQTNEIDNKSEDSPLTPDSFDKDIIIKEANDCQNNNKSIEKNGFTCDTPMNKQNTIPNTNNNNTNNNNTVHTDSCILYSNTSKYL